MEAGKRKGHHMAAPPGWKVERRPRTNEKYIGRIDWLYFEPGTGRRYRSRKSAWARYAETRQEDPDDMNDAMMTPKELEKTRKPNMKRLAMMKGRTASFDFLNSPKSVTWVLTDVEEDKWYPFIGNKIVPEVDYKLWEETFKLSMMWKGWPGSKVKGNQEADVRRGSN